jgi:hypothetical protein
MDRNIVYPGAIPLDTDLLGTNRNAMVAIAALTSATLGTTPAVDGLSVVPSAAGGLAVDVQSGSLTALSPLDQSAYGSLPADLTDSIVKTGINLGAVTLPLSAPSTNGWAIAFLIQAAFQEQDVDPIVLPYYNAANPTQPFLGPNNTGAAQPTLRQQSVALMAKAGAAAVAGSNQVPTPDPGWVGLGIVTVTYGQTVVSGSNIATWPYTRFIPNKLPDLRPGFASSQVFLDSGQFVLPPTVTRVKVTVIGGGGAGGTHTVLPGGGGGAGGWAIGWFAGLVPGTVIPLTVGAAGLASTTPQNGNPGGTTAFGTYIAATGGQGGGGGNVMVAPPGGQGGEGYGGQVIANGSYGGDGIPIASVGGFGGGPGGGRGATNLASGVVGQGPGGGGGGGGSSLPNGGGQGAPGGQGCAGILIVEY